MTYMRVGLGSWCALSLAVACGSNNANIGSNQHTTGGETAPDTGGRESTGGRQSSGGRENTGGASSMAGALADGEAGAPNDGNTPGGEAGAPNDGNTPGGSGGMLDGSTGGIPTTPDGGAGGAGGAESRDWCDDVDPETFALRTSIEDACNDIADFYFLTRCSTWEESVEDLRKALARVSGCEWVAHRATISSGCDRTTISHPEAGGFDYIEHTYDEDKNLIGLIDKGDFSPLMCDGRAVLGYIAGTTLSDCPEATHCRLCPNPALEDQVLCSDELDPTLDCETGEMTMGVVQAHFGAPLPWEVDSPGDFGDREWFSSYACNEDQSRSVSLGCGIRTLTFAEGSRRLSLHLDALDDLEVGMEIADDTPFGPCPGRTEYWAGVRLSDCEDVATCYDCAVDGPDVPDDSGCWDAAP